MRRILPAVFILLIAGVVGAAPEPDAWWPQWRGPLGTGVGPAADPPSRWSESENLRWKVAIPGRGHASPVVWGDRIYLTTAVPTEATAAPEPPAPGQRPRGISATGPLRFVVMALDRVTGETVWQRTAREAVPHEGTHRDGTSTLR